MGTTPSSHLGLTAGSYEAWCLDQATWYLGTVITSELQKAGQKKAKGEATSEAARKRVLAKYLGAESPNEGFASPPIA